MGLKRCPSDRKSRPPEKKTSIASLPSYIKIHEAIFEYTDASKHCKFGDFQGGIEQNNNSVSKVLEPLILVHLQWRNELQ